MTDTTQPSHTKPTLDFSGLGRLATCESSLQPLLQAVDDYARSRADGSLQPGPGFALVDAAVKASQVMAHSSLFKSNCSHLLQSGLTYTRDEGDKEDMPTYTRITAVTHAAWQAIATAVDMRPNLLHYKSVCDTLRYAFGTQHRGALGHKTLCRYDLMLQKLEGAANSAFVPSGYTVRLADHMYDWAHVVAGQSPVYTGQPFPQRAQPLKLAERAHALGRHLKQPGATIRSL